MLKHSPAKPLEKDIERILCWEIRKRGGVAYKFQIPGRRGAPDRIVFIAGRTFLVEVKRHDGRIRPQQKLFAKEAEALGFKVSFPHSIPDVMDLIKHIEEVINYVPASQRRGSKERVGNLSEVSSKVGC
jgi:hypothetical protein